MTINKAQGQSITGSLGLDLTYQCFSRGQLYVALSRTTNPSNVFVLTGNNTKKTKNVVYSEVLSSYSRLKVKLTVCIGDPVQEISIMSNPITAFENDYGNAPDRISCGNVTLHSSAVKSLIAPNRWVYDSAISALLGLIDSESTVTFDATFLMLLRRAKHHKVIQSASDFLTIPV